MASTSASNENEKQCTSDFCKDFGKWFNNKAFRNHKYQYHREFYNLNYTDQEGNKQQVQISRVNDLLICKFCSREYKSVDALRKHIVSGEANCSNDNISLDSDVEDYSPSLTLAAVPTTDTMTEAPILTTKHDKLHDSDQAIVHACQSMDAAVEEKTKINGSLNS